MDTPPLKFKAIGEDVRIYPGAKIIGAEHIEIGSHVIIDDFVFIHARAPMTIGNHVHIAAFSSVVGGGTCILEDFSGLSTGTRIFTGSEDFSGRGLTNPTVPDKFRTVKRSFVILRAHVIVGANCVVLPGVTIGAGAAVGAGSVVRKSLEAWTTYAGNPLRRLGRRPHAALLAAEAALLAEEGAPKKIYRDLSP